MLALHCNFANIFLDALFKSRTDTRSVDALFIQYLVTLAFDFKSPLCIPKLLYYIRLGQRRKSAAVVPPEILAFCEPLIFVALSKSLHLWPLNDPSSYPPDIKKNLVILLLASMADCSSNNEPKASHQKVRSIAFFLLALARSGHAQLILTSDTKDRSRKEFEAFEPAISQFAKILQPIDPVLSRDIVNTYNSIFAAIKHPNSFSNPDSFLKPTRVFRMIWLESHLLSLRKTQADVFANELQFFLVHESPLKLISNLITASFDGLSVSLLRKDSNEALWKAFILKRLPLVVRSLLAASFININPTQIESIICQPITMLSRDSVNLICRGDNNNSLVDEMFPSQNSSDIRFDFIKALVALPVLTEHAFHILVPEPFSYTVQRIDENALLNDGLIVDFTTGNSFYLNSVSSAALQENSEYTPFEESSIVKLVDCFKDLEGIFQERIAAELLRIFELWLEESNTHNINRLCQALAVNLATLDVLLLHVTPQSLFAPLAKLLDDWRHDEDEVNFQDGYTDFGCILLMVILGHERYNLEYSHLESNSFCLSLLRQAGFSEGLDDLSFENRELLGGWITALFDAGGISDDLMKISSVKDLYTLVPTIFKQAVAACSAKIIDLDTLRGGLEYFLQPFLLATLVGAFRWIGNSIWLQQDVMALLQIVQTLLTSEISGEAQRIHSIVLSITAPNLYPMLSQISNSAAGDDSMFVEPRILSILEAYYTPTSNVLLDHAGASVATALTTHVALLVNWSSVANETSPPGYKRELVGAAARELGATRVLLIFLDYLSEVSSPASSTATGVGASTASGAGAGIGAIELYDNTVNVITALFVVSANPPPALGGAQRLDCNLMEVIAETTESQILELRQFFSTSNSVGSVKTENTKPSTTSVDSTPNANTSTNTAAGAAGGNALDSESKDRWLKGFRTLKQNVNGYLNRKSAMEAVVERSTIINSSGSGAGLGIGLAGSSGPQGSGVVG